MAGWPLVTGLVVVIAGGLGAGLRFLVSDWAARRVSVEFPWGTAFANGCGALLLGGAVGAGLGGVAMSAVVGVLSGFTTYSTWTVESVSLWREGPGGRLPAAVNHLGLFIVGLALAWVGWAVGGLFA